MKKKLFFLFFNKFIFAAGLLEGNISDLLYPFLNFLIFIGILFFSLKKVVISFFENKTMEISRIFKRAESKMIESKKKKSSFEEKMKNIEKEILEISKKTDEEIELFRKESEKRRKEKVKEKKENSNAMINAEEKQLLAKINLELKEKIVNETKAQIKNDKQLQKKATMNIMEII